MRSGQGAARVTSFVRCGDEMWTYWVWTAVVEAGDGSRWVDFEVGERSEETFLRLYERLPAAMMKSYTNTY
ncbi:MAG: IS1 family transposase [Chloroflexi bacterium]|nr:IS1 family transposase [Chloroflexota bacterium]